MPGNKHCFYKNCNSDSRYKQRDSMKGVSFFPIPKPTTKLEECKRWLKACGREDFGIEHITGNIYVCSLHFMVSRPTDEFPDPEAYFYQQPMNDLNNEKEMLLEESPYRIDLNNGHLKLIGHATYAVLNRDECLNIQEPKTFLPLGTFSIEPSDSHNDNESQVDSTNVPEKRSQNSVSRTEKKMSKRRKHSPSILMVQGALNLCPELLYLTFLHKTVGQPPGWYSKVSGKQLEFFKVDKKNLAVPVQYVVSQDRSTRLTVLGRPLESHLINPLLPDSIDNEETLKKAIFELNQWQFCRGNMEEHLVDIFHQRNRDRGFFCWMTNGAHDRECQLLSKNNRCKPCTKLRTYLQCTISKLRNKIEGNKTSLVKQSIINGKHSTARELKMQIKMLKAQLKTCLDKGSSEEQETSNEDNSLDEDFILKNQYMECRDENFRNDIVGNE